MLVKIDYRIVFNDLDQQIGRYGVDYNFLNTYNDIACRTFDILNDLSKYENINMNDGSVKLDSIYVNCGETFKKILKKNLNNNIEDHNYNFKITLFWNHNSF